MIVLCLCIITCFKRSCMFTFIHLNCYLLHCCRSTLPTQQPSSQGWHSLISPLRSLQDSSSTMTSSNVSWSYLHKIMFLFLVKTPLTHFKHCIFLNSKITAKVEQKKIPYFFIKPQRSLLYGIISKHASVSR